MGISKAQEKMNDVRSRLVIKYPFFGILALRLTFIESNMEGMLAATMGVTADKKLIYNPEFVNSLSISDLAIVFCHEILHLVQQVHSRFPLGGDPAVWNIASDYAVNSMILETDLCDDKEDNILDKIFPIEAREWAKGKGTEQMYLAMMREDFSPPQPRIKFGDSEEDKPGNHPCNGLGCQSGSILKEMTSAQKAEVEENILSAAIAQQEYNKIKNKGNLPGFLEEFLARISKPMITWKDHLRRAAYHSFKGLYTWNRPGRRSEAIGMRLPARKPTPKGAVVSIDTSGSISDQLINRFLGECIGILDACGCPWIEVMFHDVDVYLKEKFNRKTLSKIRIQRGGTSHIDVFSKIEESKQRVGMYIGFTDLYTSFPPEIPKFPVIWCCPDGESGTAPWGKVLKIKWNEQ